MIEVRDEVRRGRKKKQPKNRETPQSCLSLVIHALTSRLLEEGYNGRNLLTRTKQGYFWLADLELLSHHFLAHLVLLAKNVLLT